MSSDKLAQLVERGALKGKVMSSMVKEWKNERVKE